MPYKKQPNNIQVFGEVTKTTHTQLKDYKSRYSMPMYMIVSMCIYWAMNNTEFEQWLITKIQSLSIWNNN